MSNKHHHHAMALVAAVIIMNTHIAQSVRAEKSTGHEWTKNKVFKLIEESASFPPRDGFDEELDRLEDDVDTVSKYLIEILEESNNGTMIANTLALISYSKNKHELFANAISNKLESFKSDDPYNMDSLKWGAARTFGIFKQARENANANILIGGTNPTQTDTPQPEPPTPANTNETIQDAQETPPEHPEKTSSNKPILWLAVIALLAIIGGVAVWNKNKRK